MPFGALQGGQQTQFDGTDVFRLNAPACLRTFSLPEQLDYHFVIWGSVHAWDGSNRPLLSKASDVGIGSGKYGGDVFSDFSPTGVKRCARPDLCGRSEHLRDSNNSGLATGCGLFAFCRLQLNSIPISSNMAWANILADGPSWTSVTFRRRHIFGERSAAG